MRKITVRNVGPIKDAQLELKKINILIGQQSTGKSTLAKIACYCSWVEKEISIAQSPAEFEAENYFADNLTEFHKLSGYLSKQSVIAFTSEVLSFEYANNSFSFHWNEGRLNYKRRKTLYIPAERNIVSVIPNWFEVNLGFNNTRSFLADWETVRKYFSKEKPLPILDIGKYYHRASDNSDHIITKDNKDILMESASSGLQAMVPLQALIQYYGDNYYNDGLKWKESNVNIQQKMHHLYGNILQQLLNTLSNEEIAAWESKRNEIIKENNDISLLSEEVRRSLIFPNPEIESQYNRIASQFRYPSSTAFFIEEPELNLYPITQYKLVNTIVKMVNDMNHTLFITTHSPYILTSLNNLIYAGEIGKQHQKETEQVIPQNLWINKDYVSAWKINADTYMLENLLADDLNILRAEELDDVSEIINNQFSELFEIANQ
jgi:predicted ATPase